MTSTLPEDPYHALGLTSDATSAAIKTAYRKLVLKHHPDKVQDETLKQSAADLFHKIQSAWETIGDDDKRLRYDAQARLASLRKEVVDRDRERQYYGSGSSGARTDARPPPFRSATESRPYAAFRDADRGAYRTEEVRPHDEGYFDRPRSVDRRDFDVQHDRPRRTPPKDDRRGSSKLARQDSKDTERARRTEKVRQSTKATARDRDYKYSTYSYPDVQSDSDSEPYRERRRNAREEESRAYSEKERRRSEDVANSRYAEERATRAAKEHIERTMRRQHSDQPRRPSPPPARMSSRDHSDLVKDSSGRPVAFRRGSGRPKPRDDDEDYHRRRRDDRSSGEYDDLPRRPPGLSQAKSAPTDIHLPPYDKPRANSAQLSSEQMKEFIAPAVKRADSMPLQGSIRSKPLRASTLRQSEINDDYDMRKASSSRSYAASPSRSPKKAYADDYEKPTPDGYVIETREPGSSRKVTRSPDSIREKTRSASTRAAAPLPRLNTTRTTSYAYTDPSEGVQKVMPSRPKLAREGSSRKVSTLYGEVPTSASPRDREAYPTSASRSAAEYREIRPDYKMHSGHSGSRRASENRSPSYYRANSFNAIPSVSG